MPTFDLGKVVGPAGAAGADGISPVVSVSTITGGHRITITDANGTKTVDVMDGGDGQDGNNGKDGNGIKSAVLNADYTLTLTFDDGTSYTTPSIRGATGSSGEKGKDGTSVTHSWDGTTLTVTSASGTSSANLKGEKGEKGDSVKGDQGNPGADGVSPTVAVSKSGKVTTISITDKNGTKTATVNDGVDGSAGKDGTSVTVASVSESTADGGSNVVNFSDGKTVTIKNGSKGSKGADGKTPVKGVDYWTPTDQEAIVQQVITALGTPVFGRVDADNNIILTGELAEGTYTIKYEDAEGNVTVIGTLEHDGEDAPTYTNLLPLAINADGTTFNGGQGWKTGYRLNSSATETAQTGIEVIGFVPVTRASTVYFHDIKWPYDGSNNTHFYVCFYDSNFAKVSSVKNNSDHSNHGCTYDAEKNMLSMSVDKWLNYFGNTSAVSYIRISAEEITADSIITVDQPIE